jgi:CshA-type fibril repeat protein
LSYSDVSSPTGKVDSGEVEDYSLTIVIATQVTTTTSTPTTTVAPNTVAPTTVPATTVAPTTTVAPGTTAPVTTTTVRPTTTTTLPPAPSALPDYSIGAQGATQVLSPLGNDNGGNTSHPLDPLTLKLCGLTEVSPNCTKTTLTMPGEGTYTVNPDGTVQFVPEPNFVGVATPRPYIVRDSFNRPAASTLNPKVVPPPAPIASVDRGTNVQGSTVVLQPWINDNAGTIPAGQTGTVSLVPTSIRLCGPTDVVPTCTRTALATADGTYTVDMVTGAVAFVHRVGFSGVVKQPVTYQIANNWSGLSGVGISSSVLIPTITTLGKADVVDQRVTTQPGVAGWLNPTQFGTPAPGATWKISTLQIWNPSTKKWTTSVTTADGVWTVVRGNVRFMPRDGFVGTASLPFRISDTAGHLVNATLFATIREGFELPATGGSSHTMVILALFLFAIGLEIRRPRRMA